MKVLVQWSRRSVRDWTEMGAPDFRRMPKKDLPRGGEALDDRAGWVHALNVQGVVFTGYDHYAVEALPNGDTRVTVWIDDPEDPTYYGFYARVWTFRPYARDPRFGGAWNTRQTQVVYGQEYMQRWYEQNPTQGLVVRPWEDFVPPPEEVTRHGIWTTDEHHQRLEDARGVRGWREWTDGVDADDIEGGRVRQQRRVGRYDRPRGTKTYYGSTNGIVGVHNSGLLSSNDDFALPTTTGTPTSDSSGNLGGGASGLFFAFTTNAGEPNSAAWPTGTYRMQFDVTTQGGDISYGARTAGSANGHFARVNSGATSDLETKADPQALFTGTGLKLATTGSVSWTAGAASNRYEVLLAGTRPASHGNQSITLELNETDDFADGPWTVTIPLTVAGSLSFAGDPTFKTIRGLIVAGALTFAGVLVRKTRKIVGWTDAKERPDSDVSNAGAWTPTPLWQQLDDDLKLPEADPISNSGTGVKSCEVGLSNVADPGVDEKHVLRWRFRLHNDTAAQPEIQCLLIEGVTARATSGPFDATLFGDNIYGTVSLLLTPAEAAAISDYTNLRARLIYNGAAAGDTVDVEAVEFEVPVPNQLTSARALETRRVRTVVLTAALSFLGTITRKTQKAFTGILSDVGGINGELNLLTKTAMAGAVGFGGDLTRNTKKVLDGAVSFVGGLTTRSIRALNLTGAVSFAGVLVRKTNKVLSSALTFVGDLVTNYIPGGALFTLNLGGDLTFLGEINRKTSKLLDGAASFTGDLVRKTSTALAGAVSFAGVLVRKTKKVLDGASSFVGTLTTRKIATISLSGAVSFVGDIVRKTTKVLAGAITPDGALSRKTKTAMAGAVTPDGALTKTTRKPLVGSTSFSGAIGKKTVKALAGVTSFGGLLVRKTKKVLTGVLTSSGLLDPSLVGGVTEEEIMAAVMPQIARGATIATVADRRYKEMLRVVAARRYFRFDSWLEVPTVWTTYGRPFLFTAANWGTGGWYLEAYLRSTTAGVNVYAEVVDINGNPLSDAILHTRSATLIRVRSARIPDGTLQDGTEYRVRFGHRTGATGAFISGQLVNVQEQET